VRIENRVGPMGTGGRRPTMENRSPEIRNVKSHLNRFRRALAASEAEVYRIRRKRMVIEG